MQISSLGQQSSQKCKEEDEEEEKIEARKRRIRETVEGYGWTVMVAK